MSRQTAVLKLYGTGAATANAVAQVVIPNKSHIIGVQACVWATSITAASQANIEISKASAKEIHVNGSQQCVCEVGIASNFVTSGLDVIAVNQFFPVSIPVVQGQIIYLHALVTGTVTYDATFLLFYA